MREEPEFNVDEAIAEANSRKDELFPGKYKENKTQLSEKAEKFSSVDKMELIMEGFINECNEKNFDNILHDITEVTKVYPELNFAVKIKIENSIKNINAKIMSEKKRSNEEMMELIKKYNILKKLKDTLYSNISKREE